MASRDRSQEFFALRSAGGDAAVRETVDRVGRGESSLRVDLQCSLVGVANAAALFSTFATHPLGICELDLRCDCSPPLPV